MKSVQSNHGYELSVGEARRLSHSASYLLSPNSSNHYSIAPDCLKLSKSMWSRRLGYLTRLQTIHTFWRGIRSLCSEILAPVHVHKESMLLCNTNDKPNSGFSIQERWNHGIDENFHGENFKWDEVHRTPITFAANSRRNCAQISRNNAPASHNRLPHEVLRTWAAAYGFFWSQEPRRSLYFASWWYGRFHYSRTRWPWCCSNSRDDAAFETRTNPPNVAWW
jgi:hypothetical protein